MISNLPSYRHEQRMPFGKEESPSWNSLRISTASQVAQVPGGALPSGASSVCAPSTAAVLSFCLAAARSMSFGQVGENGHFPRDSTHRWAQYPRNPRTTGWNLCDNISQYSRKLRRLSSGVFVEETTSLLGLQYWEFIVTGTSFLTFHYLQQHLSSF